MPGGAVTRKKRARQLIVRWLPQVAVVLAIVAFLGWLFHNVTTNLARRGIMMGFDFLDRAARFPISESVLDYSPVDSFARAFLVGITNTLFISLLVIVCSTALGFLVALGRRSPHPLALGVATTYVETARNTPLVVQLLFWYAVVTFGLPPVAEALNPLPGVYLTERGLYFPRITFSDATFALEYPTLGRFNFMGGLTLTPEFVAILLGLTLYSTAFVAEIIRGGIDAISRGQWEAGRALGLDERQTLRLIVMPQALRVIIPPMTSQYINIIKNSTLALVVGYPELNFVTATSINQTGQAIEGIAILMLTFLMVSAAASLLMNWYNRRMALPQR